MSDSNANEAEDTTKISPLVTWIISGASVVLILWLITYCADDAHRLQFQAAGDAVAVIAALASVTATIFILRQLQLQQTQMKRQAEDSHADRLARQQDIALERLDRISRVYAEWAAATSQVFYVLATPSTTDSVAEAQHREAVARNTVTLIDPVMERATLVTKFEYPSPFHHDLANAHLRAKMAELRMMLALDRVRITLGDPLGAMVPRHDATPDPFDQPRVSLPREA
jgi:hypothetical protein